MLLGLLVALVGFVPVVGPVLHGLVLFPAVVGFVHGYYAVDIPLTMLVLGVLTTLMAVVYTVIGCVLGLLLLAAVVD